MPLLRMVVVAAAAIGLVALAAFIVVRLLRSRTAGLSIRMQVFLALASIVGAFAFALGALVLDRIKERADLVGREAALGEARAAASLVGVEMESTGRTLDEVAGLLEKARRFDSGGETGPHLALIDRAGRVVFARGRSPDEPGTVTVLVPIEVKGDVVGQARVVKPTLLIRRTLADLAPTVLVISLLLGTVAAVAAALIGRAIATPIEALTQFAERINLGERRAPPPPGHGREVMRLSRALDEMRRELEGRPFVETFAADLSHELKNPVAAIRASAEVLRDGALDEPEEAARFVGRILEATGRIEALLGDLLSLAKLEARGVEQAAEVDLGETARRAVAEVAVEAAVDVEGEVRVRGDETWLRRAIRNLVDNARQHGEAGSIEVRVERSGDEVRCAVKNSGRVSRAVQKRIFRRFVTTRADKGGTGLGLAIVRAIAEAHGGEAQCTSAGPPSVEFVISLPAA
jgi:two-component system, OmpR family, sensor histidine kinase CreC